MSGGHETTSKSSVSSEWKLFKVKTHPGFSSHSPGRTCPSAACRCRSTLSWRSAGSSPGIKTLQGGTPSSSLWWKSSRLIPLNRVVGNLRPSTCWKLWIRLEICFDSSSCRRKARLHLILRAAGERWSTLIWTLSKFSFHQDPGGMLWLIANQINQTVFNSVFLYYKKHKATSCLAMHTISQLVNNNKEINRHW